MIHPENEANPLSHAIETVTRYVIDGKEFTTPEKAIEYRENQVETLLRIALNKTDISGRQKIDFVQFILDNRAELRKLLDY